MTIPYSLKINCSADDYFKNPLSSEAIIKARKACQRIDETQNQLMGVISIAAFTILLAANIYLTIDLKSGFLGFLYFLLLSILLTTIIRIVGFIFVNVLINTKSVISIKVGDLKHFWGSGSLADYKIDPSKVAHHEAASRMLKKIHGQGRDPVYFEAFVLRSIVCI